MNELLTWSNQQHTNFINAERICLQSIVPPLRGYHLLLLGNNKSLAWLPEHRLHGFTLAPFSQQSKAHVTANFDDLPLRDASIDAAIIPYLLEYIEHPEQLLNELFRVIIAEGKLFIFGFQRFHPWCWFNAPKSNHSLPLWEVKRLIARTNYTINKIHWLNYGAVYCIETQKHIIGVTPIRPQWTKPVLEKNWQPAVRNPG